MNCDDFIAALDLPARCRVDRRVPKKLLAENGAPTAADRRLIQDSVEELRWVAALKPANIAVPAWRDDARDYLEIAVLRLVPRRVPGASPRRYKAATMRLVELIHRAIPYPVLLATDGPRPGASAAHIRRSQGEKGRTVLDGDLVVAEWGGADAPFAAAFARALALGALPRTHLFALYGGWLDALTAYRAAHVTGAFAPAHSPAHAAARRDALREFERLGVEMARLRASAKRTKQMARLVDLNLELNRLETRRAEVRSQL